ncbi:F0F1 ATP synthase subunit B family protein [Desulfurivibrio alkaliphilus]|uniref:ATP synthase subunit b n=1 Tax=Desulfurivibrio alkaliphilus (strain DSM 19089 / UNIQEM U267 / AHT2) TaxID=589865 RepID=D6Z4V5_DESAT|nr:ATP synthase F0 subunit B [Desulfurivibrio alkaliphilus]ADH86580.1 H+transporting two-sector ATPase B/B' subunit [Desulfurivibrio alkaliphilus AHT 2]
MRYLKAKYGVALLVAALVLVTAAAAQAAEIKPEKVWDLFYRVLNFAALLFILIYFLKRPTVNFFTNRRESIRAELEELESRRQEMEQAYRESESKMASLESKAQEIVAEAVRQGEVERERILAEAERAAENMKRQAEMAVQHELATATARLRAEISEEAARAAEELVRKNLQPADEERMIAGSLDRVGGVQ